MGRELTVDTYSEGAPDATVRAIVMLPTSEGAKAKYATAPAATAPGLGTPSVTLMMAAPVEAVRMYVDAV